MLALALKAPPPGPVDMSPIVPDALASKPRRDIEDLLLRCGNRRLRVGDWFAIDGEADGDILIRGGSPSMLRIGAGMTTGSVTVEGDVGMYAGALMQGGALDIHGNAGAFAACAMRGGLLRVRGSAGDFVGGPLPGSRRGMEGGSVIVDGGAGDRVGDRMRRGIVMIGGDVGDYCGARMLAGTIVVRGSVGQGIGDGMQRGTLLLARATSLPWTFTDCGVHDLTFLRVLGAHLAADDGSARFAPTGIVHRFVGDRSYGGRGEILIEQR